MAQVVNRKTGAVHGDPTPKRDIQWETLPSGLSQLTTPATRAPQISMTEALDLVKDKPDLIVTCPHGKWWSYASGS